MSATARARTRGADFAATLESGPMSATFLVNVGLLGVSLRHGEQELLVLPGGVEAYRALHTVGLPLVAPWINRLAGWDYTAAGQSVDLSGQRIPTDEHGLPIHGTITARDGWTLHELSADGDVARFRASFGYDEPDLLAAFPFPHAISVDVACRPSGLTISTTVSCSATVDVPVSFGFHPYLRLPGGPAAGWELRLPAAEAAELDETGIPTGQWAPVPATVETVGARPHDDLYRVGTDREAWVEADGQRVGLRLGEGFGFLQVFTPPTDAICLEPMTAPVNALRTGMTQWARPGSPYRAEFELVVTGRWT